MARTVADCAALLTGMVAGDPDSSPLLPPPAPMPAPALSPGPGPRPLEGTTIALTDRTAGIGLQQQVASGLEQAARACERLGARLVERVSPWIFDWNDLSIILLTEAWAYHSAHRGRHQRYRPAIAEFLEAACNFTPAAPYLAAQQRRARGAAHWERWFGSESVDLVLEPTLPIVPFERGPGYDRGHAGGPGDPMIALTALWDMTGMPVAALPGHLGGRRIADRAARPRGAADPGRDRPSGACARSAALGANALVCRHARVCPAAAGRAPAGRAPPGRAWLAPAGRAAGASVAGAGGTGRRGTGRRGRRSRRRAEVAGVHIATEQARKPRLVAPDTYTVHSATGLARIVGFVVLCTLPTPEGQRPINPRHWFHVKGNELPAARGQRSLRQELRVAGNELPASSSATCHPERACQPRAACQPPSDLSAPSPVSPRAACQPASAYCSTS